MGKVVKRLFITLIVLIVIIVGAGWWFLSYIAPDKQLDMAHETIDIREKAASMVKRLKPELILTESDVNHLIKSHMNPNIAEGIRVDGADFKLEENRLLADLNITYQERIPAQIQAEYRLEWQEPNLVLIPETLAMKGINLPLRMLESLTIPLDLPTADLVTVQSVKFEANQIKVLFKLNFSLH
ncbi:hypothetical protein I6N90_12885 [Paenibacillus sp. GSMTC-2017]|uniref:hypothetical protein n=1 Tax=Paenibacillus sp. GSMTC-2017 TaxID=2794350 RepID=UPI0018D9837B|nr:hypothetical protein [Paenibacillus sp. GSMTC-2017]MBH5318694.1 hypothetical protein [Paenibacillus sp. GSMTC-2017]